MNGDMGLFTQIRSKGFDVTNFQMFGNNLLHTAAYHGRINIVEVLLRLGMDIHGRGNNGNTALHYAANQNRKAMVEYLIRIFYFIIL